MKTRKKINSNLFQMFLILLLVSWISTGCGGGSEVQPLSPDVSPDDNQTDQVSDPPEEPFYTPDPSQETGVLKFSVNWPRNHAGQIIPDETNRIIIYISGEDISPAMAVILNDVEQPSTNVTVNVPSGSDRLVSAIARHVDDMPAGTPAVDYKPKYRDLLKGTMLASGSTNAFDIVEDEQKSVTVTLELPSELDEDDDYIIARGSQFDPNDFPTIVIYCSIVDQDDKPILDITMANLRVFEKTEGWSKAREAVITDVRYVDQSGQLEAGSIVLCLDKSGSMWGQPFSDLKDAANLFVDLMHDNDQGEIVNFSSGVYLDQTFTTDKDLLRVGINKWYGNMTALYDAVYQSISDAGLQDGRKAVLIMTDGMENVSSHTLMDIVNLVSANHVPCYAIGLGNVDTVGLTNLANATGGVAYFTPTSEELEDIYKQIAIELGTQIRITYVTPDPIDYDPDKLHHVYVYLTNYPPLTDGGDILGFETTYYH